MKKPVIVINVPSLILIVIFSLFQLSTHYQSKEIEKKAQPEIQKTGHADLGSLIELYNKLKKVQDEKSSKHYLDSVQTRNNSRMI